MAFKKLFINEQSIPEQETATAAATTPKINILTLQAVFLPFILIRKSSLSFCVS